MFFFKQKTAYEMRISDWSSDVCSSDLFFSLMTNVELTAVPLFLFMGYVLEQSGLMDRMFNALQMTLGKTKGSLYIIVLVTATVFAAATGIVGASVTVLGVMAAPMLIRSGYDTRLSAGSIAAGGTLGILIRSEEHTSELQSLM